MLADRGLSVKRPSLRDEKSEGSGMVY